MSLPEQPRPPIRLLALMESTSVGGPAKNLIEFARRAVRPTPELRGVVLSLATYQREGSGGASPFVEATRAAGIEVHLIPERWRYDTGVMRHLRVVVDEVRPDIIQSHNIKSHLLVRLSGLWRHYPWIAFHHGYTAVSWSDRMYRVFDRVSLPAAFRVVTVCHAFREDLCHIGVPKSRILVRHNSVDDFAAPNADLISKLHPQIPKGVPIFLSVGRLSREKAHGDLIRAVALLRSRKPSIAFHLVVVGDGPERATLERACRQGELENTVTFAGHRNDVRPYYASARALVLPSQTEGSPNVVLEAMAAGLPVIATNVGGIPEIIRDEVDGCLVPARDPEAIAGAMARLLTDADTAHNWGAAGRRVASENYSRDAYRASLVRLYEQVLLDFQFRGER